MKWLAVGCGWVLGVVSPQIAFAQAQVVVEEKQAPSVAEELNKASTAAQAKQAARTMGSGSPNDRALAGFAFPNLSVATEDGETTVSFAISAKLSDGTPRATGRKGTDGAEFYRVSQSKLSLVASAPIEGKGGGLATLFAGDSLIHGAKVKLAFSNITNTLGNARGAARLLPPAYERCIRERVGNWLSTRPGQPITPESYAQSIPISARGNYESYLEEQAMEDGAIELDEFVFTQCVPGGTPEKPNRYQDDGQLVRAYTAFGDDFVSRFYDRGSWMLVYGTDASVGQEDYTYLDRTTFTTPEIDRTSWEVAAYLGTVNWSSTFSARARVVYSRAWELPEEGQACETAGNPPVEQCLTGPDGPPERLDTTLVSVETRHLFKIDAKRTIALAPQITWREEEDVVGVEVPVYLVPDADGQLTGGFKFAWTSRGNEFGVGVFVGVPFPGVTF